MSIASYGNTRVSDVSINDIDIFYTYVQDRSVINTNAKATSIDATTVLSPIQHPVRNDILGIILYFLNISNILFKTSLCNSTICVSFSDLITVIISFSVNL